MIITTIIAGTVLSFSSLIVPVALADHLLEKHATDGARYESISTKLRKWIRGVPVNPLDEYLARELLLLRENADDTLPELLYGQDNLAFFLHSVHEEVASGNLKAKDANKMLREEVNLGGPHVQPITRRRGRSLTALMAIEAKNKFPLFTRSNANRMVVRNFIYKRLTEHGVRPAHIRKILDPAVALAFVPDDIDEEVNSFESTAIVNRMHELAGEVRTNNSRPMNLFNWRQFVGTRRGYSTG